MNTALANDAEPFPEQARAASLSLRDPAVSARIESLATLICGTKLSAALWEQALIIAETQILLQDIRVARVAALDQALSRPVFEVVGTMFTGAVEALGDDGDDWRGAAKYMKGLAKALPHLLAIRISKAGSKIKITPAPPAPPASKPMRLSDIPYGLNERLSEVLPELSKFDRYEKRALSRRRQAARRFTAISVLEAEAGSGLQGRGTTNSRKSSSN
jgi:hypothetical protein